VHDAVAERRRERRDRAADGRPGLPLRLVAVEQLANVLHANVVGLLPAERREHVLVQARLVRVDGRLGACAEHAALAGDEVLDERLYQLSYVGSGHA